MYQSCSQRVLHFISDYIFKIMYATPEPTANFPMLCIVVDFNSKFVLIKKKRPNIIYII